MELIDPFESVSKATPFYPTSSTRLRALVPTGAHVGHGLDLHHVHNGSGGGGRRAGLEHYRGAHTGGFGKGLVTPFDQAADGGLVGKGLPKFRAPGSFTLGEKAATAATYGSKGDTQVVFRGPQKARANQAAVNRGLDMISGMPKRSAIGSQNASSAGRRIT